MNITIPADVPSNETQEFLNNYKAITGPTGNLLLFATDQKIEHLNQDFYGTNIAEDTRHPEHIFNIAQQGTVGAMASHLGLISRYGKSYPDINYIIKLNGKTNLIKQEDPLSRLLWTVDDVVDLKRESDLKIRGIGITVYLGSEFESEMLSDAAQSIFEAHQHGLIAILWCYIRGKEISNLQDPELAAGAAGVGASLGADFVKIKPPVATKTLSYVNALKLACDTAGNTKVICSGGQKIEEQQLLATIQEQLSAGTAGCAIGRNIFQRSLPEAIKITKGLSALINSPAVAGEDPDEG